MNQPTEHRSYDSDNKTLITTSVKKFIDPETGEVVYFDNIVKRIYGDRNFWKCYLMDFLTVLGIFNSRQVDVFIYIAENTSPANNLFIGTYKKIAKDVNVCEATISKIMKKLQACNFIKKAQPGVWMLNPEILHKGDIAHKNLLLTYYQADNVGESFSYSKAASKAASKQREEVAVPKEAVNEASTDFL